MKRLAPILLFIGSIMAAAPLSGQQSDAPALPTWEAWHVDELSGQTEAGGRRYLPFLDRPSLSAGLYALPAGARDRQRPHQRDEVYYIRAGRATLEVGDERYGVEPGSIIFVRAGVPHRFVDIEEALRVLVVFSNRSTVESAPAWKGFTMAEVLVARKTDENVWNLFFDFPTLGFGMYMMPAPLDGDDTLVHSFDEINFVVGGESTFRVGDDAIQIRPGSIVFVEAGVGHSFDALGGDLDVLILWERRDEP